LNDEYFDDDLQENLCTELIQCYMIHILYGIRSGGGIADNLPKRLYSDHKSLVQGRLIFDLIFFFLINLIVLNMILGIIVDTFKQLREESIIYENDKKNVCYICGLTKLKMRVFNIDFDDHTNNEHNMWNYAYFFIKLLYLKDLDKNSFELHVYNLLNNDNYSFFPENTCFSMKKKIEGSQADDK